MVSLLDSIRGGVLVKMTRRLRPYTSNGDSPVPSEPDSAGVCPLSCNSLQIPGDPLHDLPVVKAPDPAAAVRGAADNVGDWAENMETGVFLLWRIFRLIKDTGGMSDTT